MKCCENLTGPFEGKKVEDIQELRDILEEERTDFSTWTTFYKCKVCGQLWIEKYEQRGHGEVPVVFKK